ncbi:MAG: DUF3108 domain-containing protein [Porphyromonas sp.]|nr:DUF3108 domain-containing protein [Porphyromonas sp.]
MNRSRKPYLLALALVILLSSTLYRPASVRAQDKSGHLPKLQDSRIFQRNETFMYDVDFRWGIIKGKMGEALLTNRTTRNGQYFSQILFRTKGIGDTFFRVRDTLETLYSMERLPLRFEKRINEGGYQYHDLITFTHLPEEKVKIGIKAGPPSVIERDTTIILSTKEEEVVDMLSTLAYLRSLNLNNIEHGLLNRFVVPIGKNLVYGSYEFGGYENSKMPDGTPKEMLKIYFNIEDKSFSQNSRSIEVWVTNDEMLLPVRINAKLSIGRVVCILTSYKGA